MLSMLCWGVVCVCVITFVPEIIPRVAFSQPLCIMVVFVVVVVVVVVVVFLFQLTFDSYN